MARPTRWIRGLLAAPALAILVAAGILGCRKEKAPVKIGIPLPLSASSADNGIMLRAAFTTYAEDVNKSGGIKGHPLQVDFADDQGNATRATALSEQFVSEGSLCLMGCNSTTEALAVKSVASRRKTPFLATGGAAVAVATPVDPWTFQIISNDEDICQDILKILIDDLQVKKPSILFVNNDWGSGGRDLYVKFLKAKYNMQFAGMEACETATLNLVPQMLRLKKSGADSVILWTSIEKVPTALKAMMKADFKVTAMSNLACTLTNFAKTGNLPIRNISHAIWSWDRPDALAVCDRLSQITGRNMKYENLWASAWVAMQVFTDAIKRADLSLDPKNIDADREKLRQAIENTQGLSVLHGTEGATVDFSPSNHRGYALKYYVSKETHNGVDWQIYKASK